MGVYVYFLLLMISKRRTCNIFRNCNVTNRSPQQYSNHISVFITNKSHEHRYLVYKLQLLYKTNNIILQGAKKTYTP